MENRYDFEIDKMLENVYFATRSNKIPGKSVVSEDG